MRVANKVTVVTGGAHGMGEAMVRLFAREGAQVVIADILVEQGEQLAADIEGAGGEALFVNLDVADETQWEAAVRATVERFERIDILVNNAGISGAVPDRMSTDHFDRLMAVNARGTFLGVK
ncbi:MAG: SDR family NAD(P)-dependent oxidoreductase, partial [Ideonella sp.]